MSLVARIYRRGRLSEKDKVDKDKKVQYRRPIGGAVQQIQELSNNETEFQLPIFVADNEAQFPIIHECPFVWLLLVSHQSHQS